jgi:hypothetical protein
MQDDDPDTIDDGDIGRPALRIDACTGRVVQPEPALDGVVKSHLRWRCSGRGDPSRRRWFTREKPRRRIADQPMRQQGVQLEVVTDPGHRQAKPATGHVVYRDGSGKSGARSAAMRLPTTPYPPTMRIEPAVMASACPRRHDATRAGGPGLHQQHGEAPGRVRHLRPGTRRRPTSVAARGEDGWTASPIKLAPIPPSLNATDPQLTTPQPRFGTVEASFGGSRPARVALIRCARR